MKRGLYFIVLIVMLNSFTKSPIYQIERNISNAEPYNIYLSNFHPVNFTRNDYLKITEITKTNGADEDLEILPNDIAYKLTSQDTVGALFYCKYIFENKGIFTLIKNNYWINFIVSFSEKGDPINYIAFLGAKRELIKGELVYTKFYSNFTFLDKYIVVKTLDTSKIVSHPDLVKVIKSDYWFTEEKNRFVKKK